MPAILVVDDDSDIACSVSDLLEDEGFVVTQASNGKEALEVLCSVPAPCLILLDLMMPVMNGWDLLDALRRRADLSRIPVIVTSAAPDANTARARALLRKPYDLDKLLATVQRYCRPGAS